MISDPVDMTWVEENKHAAHVYPQILSFVGCNRHFVLAELGRAGY